MPDNNRFKCDALRAALGPGEDCPPFEELERLLGSQHDTLPLASVAEHVQTCAYCRTEMHLLQTFQSGEVHESDAADIRQITQRLEKRSAEIFAQPDPAVREPWWKQLLTWRRTAPIATAFAGICLVVAISVQLRRSGPPALHPPAESAPEVMRSGTLAILEPSGDQPEAPKEIRWQPVPGAMKYAVRLLEVDRTELWKADTTLDRIPLPPAARARIVPAKSLFAQVSAFDASGRKLAESELVRFRLSPKIYKR